MPDTSPTSFQDRILKLDKVRWRDLQPLQPDDAKIISNYADIEESLNKYGFAQPFFVWEHKGKIYCIDGHTRKEVLSNRTDVPELLPALFIKADTRKEAIKLLLEVYNQKHNPFDKGVMLQMIESEEIPVEEINIASIYAINPKGTEDEDDLPEEQSFTPTFKLEITFTTEKKQHAAFAKLTDEGFDVRFPD